MAPNPTAKWRLQGQIFFLIASLGVSFPAGQVQADQATEDRIRLLAENITKQPQRQSLHIQLAIAYSDNQQADMALARIAIAEELGPPANAAFAHGIILYRLGKFDTARDYLSKHLEASPKHIGSLEYRARLLKDSGDFEGALRDFKALFRLNPSTNPGHYLSVARMIAALPGGGQDAALAMLDVAEQQLATASVTSSTQVLVDKIKQARLQLKKAGIR